MMPRLAYIALIVLLFPIHVLLLERASGEMRRLPKAESESYVAPAPVLKISALEFDSLASDFLYLKSLTFIGGTYERTDAVRVKEWEWTWLYNMLVVSTDLDPYFLDPYYIANANFAWKAGMITEANALLEKGTRYRTWDWTLPFLAGFNYFYFLQDNSTASEKLMEASRRPDASPMLASLASKLAFKANKTENSILFLEEMIKKTEDEPTKKLFETRVEAFKAILVLEKAVDAYRQKFKRAPANPEELVKKKIIPEIPKDPYGGKFSIDAQGKVRTTSEGLLTPYLKKK